MTEDRVSAAIAAFLDHLENRGPEPSLDHLTGAELAEASEVIALMRDARGVDYKRSRPSLDAILADTELESHLGSRRTEGLSIEVIYPEVVSALGSSAKPIADGAAEKEGIRSDAVVRLGSLRIRIQFRNDITTTTGLCEVDPRTAAAAVFGRFPETAAVVLVINDLEFSSVAIGSFDVDDFIGTPDGQVHHPRIVRPVLSLFDTLRSLVEELAPDVTGDSGIQGHESIDVHEVIRNACDSACAAVVAEGKKARTAAKVDAWSNFDAADLLTSLLEAASTRELDEAEIDARLTPAEAA